jgi:hypothetical protein
MAAVISPWHAMAFFGLYGANIFVFLLRGPTMGWASNLGGGTIIPYLMLAGLPPGPIFCAKVLVLSSVLTAFGPIWALPFALSELISWIVYLEVYATTIRVGTERVKPADLVAIILVLIICWALTP